MTIQGTETGSILYLKDMKESQFFVFEQDQDEHPELLYLMTDEGMVDINKGWFYKKQGSNFTGMANHIVHKVEMVRA